MVENVAEEEKLPAKISDLEENRNPLNIYQWKQSDEDVTICINSSFLLR